MPQRFRCRDRRLGQPCRIGITSLDATVLQPLIEVIAQRAIGDQTRGMADADEIAILRIELEGIEPLIWRRVSVQTLTSLSELHLVIQVSMGWLNCHLWQFEVGKKKYGTHLPNDPDWNERIEDANATKLSSLLGNRE